MDTPLVLDVLDIDDDAPDSEPDAPDSEPRDIGVRLLRTAMAATLRADRAHRVQPSRPAGPA